MKKGYERARVAAEMLGVSARQLQRMRASGEIKTIRTENGARWYNVTEYQTRLSTKEVFSVKDIRVRRETFGDENKETLNVFDGVRCARDRRHRGIAVQRMSDGAIVFMCANKDCLPHESTAHTRKKQPWETET